MGFFRNSFRSSSSSSSNPKPNPAENMDALPVLVANVNNACAANESSLVALLKAKIAQLEEQVESKDQALESMQANLKLDGFSTHTSDTLSLSLSDSHSSNSDSTGHRSQEEHPLVTRLTSELEDKNAQVASLRLQLEEQKTLATLLQERLRMTEEAKATLVTNMSALDLKLFDQKNQIDCLQSLNETNCTIVADLEEMHNPQGRRASSGNVSYSAGSGSQWKMYQKLESLMASNTKIAQQLTATAREKQEALGKVAKLEMDQLNLCDQVDALTKKLQEKEHKLAQLNDGDFSGSTEDDTLPSTSTSVLPQIQQVLDVFADSNSNAEEEEEEGKKDTENLKDPKLLILTLQVAQAQLRQIQKNHELQLQKTVRQSVKLAESRAAVDTLNTKVEHYENLMDQVLAKTPALQNTSALPTPEPTTTTTKTSKAARMVMDDDPEDCKVPVGIPSARQYKTPTRSDSIKKSLPVFKLFGRGTSQRVEMEC